MNESKKQWLFFGRWNDSLLFDILWFTSLDKKFFKMNGINFELSSYLCLDADFYVKEKEINKLKNLIKNKIHKKGYEKKFLLYVKRHGQELLKFSKVINSLDKTTLKNMSNTELINFFNMYINKIMPCMNNLFLGLIVEDVVAEIFDFKKLEKSNGIKISLKKQPVLIENKEFFDIVKEIKNNKLDALFLTKNNKQIRVKLAQSNFKLYLKIIEHFLKYRWLNVFSWNQNASNLNDYYYKIPILLKKKSLNIDKNISRKKITKKEKPLLNLFYEYEYCRDYRINVLSKSWFDIKNFIVELSRRLNIRYIEFAGLYINKLTLNDLTDLKRVDFKKFGILKEKDKLIPLFDSQVDKFSSKIIDDALDLNVISGSSSFAVEPVIGKVKIIKHEKDIDAMEEGAILVAHMTSPAYMFALNKASGMITDEGGILSHSAVISRELKIPCVFGTKIASKILKDGDLVELNSQEGVVKLLKRK